MAGAQSARGWQQNISTNPDQASYQATSFQSDLRNAGEAQNNPYGRDLPALRGRGPGPVNGALTPSLQPQLQSSGRAPSPRVQPSNGDAITRPIVGALERKPSVNYGHHRQTSIVHGLAQHSRNPSTTNPSTAAHRNPQSVANGTLQTGPGPGPEILSLNPMTAESPDLHINTQPSSIVNSSVQSPVASLAIPGDRNVIDAGDNTLTQKRVDRMHSGKIRRDHSRSRSKPQPEQISISEYALHHLFNSFIKQADAKINQCIPSSSSSGLQIEDVCGPGVDPDFDQLISALGHVARENPKPLIDTVMYWRKAKGEAAAVARAEVHQSKNLSSAHRTLPRRNTEPLHMLRSDGRHAANNNGSNYASATSLQDIVAQAEHRSSLSIYLLCRVLIEIYNQSSLACITPDLSERLEEIIFEQLQKTDPENLGNSPFRFANWTIYSQLLGIMSSLNFHSSVSTLRDCAQNVP